MRRRPAVKQVRSHIPRFDQQTAALIAREANALVQGEVRRLAGREAATMRNKIADQRFDSFKAHPLQPSTLARKKRYGRSLRVMMATRTYLESIGVFVRQRLGAVAFKVSVDEKRAARDTRTGAPRAGVTLGDVARMHEVAGGKAPYPARPHWGPQRAIVARRAGALRAHLAQRVREVVRRRLGFR